MCLSSTICLFAIVSCGVTIARRDEPGLKEKLRELVKMIVDDDYHYTVQTIDDAIATLKALKPLRKMHRFDDFPFLPPPILITDPVILATGQSGLGHDLVSEILMRLPVKSLMRFKCVHRSFNALFRTPTFITGHMMMQKLKHKEERLVIFENYEKPHCMISDDPSQSPINLEFEIPSTKPLRHVVPYTSSHRGIFCLYVQYDSFSPADDFILWNPATREVKLVTSPPSYIPAIMGNVVGDIHEPFLDVVNDSIAFVLPRLLTWWEAEIWILEQENCWTKKYKFGPLDWQVPIYTIWKDGAEFLGPSGTSSTYCLGDHLD
ncbi:hypothetical protein RIF29_24982 [Crotalaria pallida]|uniref:F-box domain-containing protein n=1 Tax=Crotalaria pallida TaxID=3830 RepID=A0AAN9I0P0_CROPI